MCTKSIIKNGLPLTHYPTKMNYIWVSKHLPSGCNSFRLNLLTRIETNASRKKSKAGNSWTIYQTTWKPPWFSKYLNLGHSMTFLRRLNQISLYENMGVSQQLLSLGTSHIPHQFQILVIITIGIGKQTVRTQVPILEGPPLQKQQVLRIVI